MALKTAKCAYFLPKCHAYGIFKHLLMGLFFYQNAMPTAFYEAKDVNILIQAASKRRNAQNISLKTLKIRPSKLKTGKILRGPLCVEYRV